MDFIYIMYIYLHIIIVNIYTYIIHWTFCKMQLNRFAGYFPLPSGEPMEVHCASPCIPLCIMFAGAANQN